MLWSSNDVTQQGSRPKTKLYVELEGNLSMKEKVVVDKALLQIVGGDKLIIPFC